VDFCNLIGYGIGEIIWMTLWEFGYVRRGSDKSLAFPIFLFAAQPKEIFLDWLKKLEQ
jgi:hypothetical protein